MRESTIQAQILARLGARPDCRLWRTGVVRGMSFTGQHVIQSGVPGLADLSGVLAPGGWALFVEVKSAQGVQAPVQRAFQQAVTSRGACYIVARSADDAEAAVERFLADRRTR